MYSLGSEDVIKVKQPDRAMGRPFDFSTFYFVFDDMSCRDLEDAVFVIDGLSRRGERLPPLKVRLNYYNLDAVPEHMSDQAR